jgi:hypothetical protein
LITIWALYFEFAWRVEGKDSAPTMCSQLEKNRPWESDSESARGGNNVISDQVIEHHVAAGAPQAQDPLTDILDVRDLRHTPSGVLNHPFPLCEAHLSARALICTLPDARGRGTGYAPGSLVLPSVFIRLSDTCRICSAPAEPGQPLFHPCKCSGTIRYIHQDWYGGRMHTTRCTNLFIS